MEKNKSLDHGGKPYVLNIEELTKANTNFRTAHWTGKQLQLTTMSVEVGGELGLEVHPDTDQFLRIEAGTAKVVMGSAKDNLTEEWTAEEDFAILVPAGTWHNILNVGPEELKLYSIYAPAEHPKNTVHQTYEDAQAAEAKEDR